MTAHSWEGYLEREAAQVERWGPVLAALFGTTWRRSSAAENRAGVDVWIRRRDGTEAGVDYKFCATGVESVPVEVFHTDDGGYRRLGWAFASNRTDAVAYVFEEADLLVAVPKPALVGLAVTRCDVVRRNGRATVTGGGARWWTWNLWVPLGDVVALEGARVHDPGCVLPVPEAPWI